MQIAEEFPNFSCETQLGPLQVHDYCGEGWLMMFSHPADFTPVCSTEFAVVAKLKSEFEMRNCKVLGLSCNSAESHRFWFKDIEETLHGAVDFPVIIDEDMRLSKLLGVCNQDCSNVNRGLFIVDPKKITRLVMMYPLNTGRNFDEVLRCLDSLQLTDWTQVGTPANWQKGEDVVILSEVSDAAAERLFPNGFSVLKPYLRFTPMPIARAEADVE